MASKSMIDTAYDVVSGGDKEMTFSDILLAVGKKLGLTEDELVKKAGNFYTDLSLDGRFVTLGDNLWDLRSRHKYEQVHIDMNDVYSEEDEKVSELGEEGDDEEKKPIEPGDDDDDDDDGKTPTPDITSDN